MNDAKRKIVELDLNDVLPNRFQPRIKFNEEAIIELSDSIREHGVIQPIVVRPIGDKYEIIAGERRYKASVLAGKTTIPAIITDLNDKDSAEVALIENVQRRDLTPIEEAISYKKILDMGYLTQDKLAHKLGKSQSAIANKIRLLNLCDEVQEALMEEKISERHARSLLKLDNNDKQREMLKRIIENRYTVRKTDEEIEKMNNEINNNLPIQEPEMTINNNAFNPTNPGFVDVDKIANQAQEINNDQPSSNKMDLNMLLQSDNKISNINESNNLDLSNTNNNLNTGNENLLNNTDIVQNTNSNNPVVNDFSNIFELPSAPKISGIDNSQNSNSVTPQPSIFDIGSNINEQNKVNNNITMSDLLSPNSNDIEGKVEESNGDTSNNNLDIFSPVFKEQNPSPTISIDNNNNNILFGDVENTSSTSDLLSQMEVWNPEQTNSSNLVSLDQKPDIIDEMKIPDIPMTPIMDQSSIFSEPTNEINKNSESQVMAMPSQSENSIPEPIIITDYTKQYDPVMPTVNNEPTQKVEFKQIINLIRDLSKTIEKCGYIIDTEEFDMDDMYQVIFKINKENK